jgi:hypothetical protein
VLRLFHALAASPPGGDTPRPIDWSATLEAQGPADLSALDDLSQEDAQTMLGSVELSLGPLPSSAALQVTRPISLFHESLY